MFTVESNNLRKDNLCIVMKNCISQLSAGPPWPRRGPPRTRDCEPRGPWTEKKGRRREKERDLGKEASAICWLVLRDSMTPAETARTPTQRQPQWHRNHRHGDRGSWVVWFEEPVGVSLSRRTANFRVNSGCSEAIIPLGSSRLPGPGHGAGPGAATPGCPRQPVPSPRLTARSGWSTCHWQPQSESRPGWRPRAVRGRRGRRVRGLPSGWSPSDLPLAASVRVTARVSASEDQAERLRFGRSRDIHVESETP